MVFIALLDVDEMKWNKEPPKHKNNAKNDDAEQWWKYGNIQMKMLKSAHNACHRQAEPNRTTPNDGLVGDFVNQFLQCNKIPVVVYHVLIKSATSYNQISKLLIPLMWRDYILS